MTDTIISQPEPAFGVQQSCQHALQRMLQLAVSHHQAGRLPEADRLYRAILQGEPEQPQANHNLGALLLEMGQTAASLPHFEAAVTTEPESERYWLSYIDALFQAGQADLARQILALGRQHGLHGAAAEALAEKLQIDQAPAESSDTGQESIAAAARSDLAAPAQKCRTVAEPIAAVRPKTQRPARGGRARGPGQQEMNLLVAQFNQGKYPEAELGARRLTARYRNNEFGWKLLGAALERQGRSAETVGVMRKAVKLSPWDAEAHSNLGNALRELGQLDQAIDCYHRALAIKPDWADAHCNLGSALRSLGKADQAITSLRHALKLEPDHVMALNNLGALLQDRGELDEAVTCLRRAVAINPGFDMALNNLALAQNAQGNATAALATVCRSLRLRETSDAKSIFVDCIRHLQLKLVGSDVRTALVRALSEPWGRPSDLAPNCIYLVKRDPLIGGIVGRAARAWPRRLGSQDLFGAEDGAAMVADPLLCALLDSAPISDIELERTLTMVRQILLVEATAQKTSDDAGGTALNFYGALARQCFINEYVFACTEEESKQVLRLREEAITALRGHREIPALWPLAMAAYFPLNQFELADQLAARSWCDAVNAVLTQQVREPAEERECRTAMPRLTPVDDDVSLLVQRQYEENPYPRWIKTAPAGKPLTIDGDIRLQFPLATLRPTTRDGADILIAGCGTGQKAVERAQRYPAAKILAVDLSLTSLCYAKRKARASGMTSIDFAQADILKLGSLGRSFDLIVSTGVLHHLADPLAGWRVLLSLLRPGGYMNLGFYSALARRHIVSARDFIAERGYSSTAGDIRRCRQDLVNFDAGAAFGSVLKTPDFFSISACRDLLFHVQEHRMVLPDIAAFLQDNDLQFLGFELDPAVLRLFRQRYPDDMAATNLDHWGNFENENPDTFCGMYQFWVQKAV